MPNPIDPNETTRRLAAVVATVLACLADEQPELLSRLERPTPKLKARYLDVDGCADYLCLTPQGVRTLVAKNEIPYGRIGRRLRFDITDIDLWMRRHREVGPTDAGRW